ncbi:hypothetical protein CH373_05165 [Leptospira perolatii]|uniref:histidine kinase n=1 Tax=Leptospira perolatii TaxID=2023191 RepID=A0A2M9ZQE4_9LEPT|nr:PAS domain S-box protein [Leptospira perolatii]PJZ70464.1 hypothetical protein CH360_05585 [Leptospira perolatii]PJZ74300.1 hypothetical protein CH373_05165 [Leptospira perolatii]
MDLSLLYNSILDLVYCLEVEGSGTYRFLFANKAFSSAAGLSEGEIVGKLLSEVLPSDSFKIQTKNIADAIRDRKAKSWIDYLRFRNEKIHGEVCVNPVLNGRGECTHVVGTIHDITEKKQTEEALSLSKQHLSLIYENVTDIVYYIGVEPAGKFKFLSINSAFCRATGLREDQVVGKFVTEVIPEASHELILRNYNEAIRTGRTVRWDEISVYPAGKKIGEVSITPVFDENGNCTNLVGTVHDVTERKKAEDEVRESENRFRQLTDAIREVFWLTDVQKNEMIYVSRGCEEIWGRTRESILKDPISWTKSIHPEDRERVLERASTQQILGNYNEEYRIYRPDGTMRWVKDLAFPIKNENGEVFRIAGVIEDITERKNREEQLREVELKRRILEQQLIQSQKLESLGTLASGVAHDFNNILSIILGHAYLLERLKLDPENLSKSLQAIQNASQRGASLVKQLLTFARKTEFHMELYSLNEIVKEVISMLLQTFPKDIKIVTDLYPDLPMALIDSSQIYQVILNFCVNSRDAMPKGGIIKIDTALIDGKTIREKNHETVSDQYILLTVSDNGEGMDDRTKMSIFEPFFTTKEIGKGTGLGLSLVYGIIQNHIGFIDVDTAVGRGTIFRVYLPILKYANRPDKKVVKDYYDIQGGTETILLIEDEEMLRELVGAMLESKGYKVLKASNGEEGLRLFSDHAGDIDLVITDLGLPGLHGSEVIKAIKTLDFDAKVVLASGFIEHKTKHDLMDLGITQFIQKPYQSGEILEAVRDALNE